MSDKKEIRRALVTTRNPEKWLLIDTETEEVYRGEADAEPEVFNWVDASETDHSRLLRIAIGVVVDKGLAEAEAEGTIERVGENEYRKVDKENEQQ